MHNKYQYDHGPPRHLLRHLSVTLGVSVVILASVFGLIAYDARNKQPVVIGKVAEVPQTVQAVPMLQINEPLFSMQLPIDWVETGSQDTATMHSITWQSTAKNATNRYLTLYIDTIPTTLPVNRELPLTVSGNGLASGELSDNCSDFTSGGTQNVGQAEALPPTPSTWLSVNFICNIPDVVMNQVGTGAVGSPINTVKVTGASGGTHSYFFLYTDLNIDPDYTILTNAIQSFRAK